MDNATFSQPVSNYLSGKLAGAERDVRRYNSNMRHSCSVTLGKIVWNDLQKSCKSESIEPLGALVALLKMLLFHYEKSDVVAILELSPAYTSSPIRVLNKKVRLLGTSFTTQDDDFRTCRDFFRLVNDSITVCQETELMVDVIYPAFVVVPSIVDTLSFNGNVNSSLEGYNAEVVVYVQHDAPDLTITMSCIDYMYTADAVKRMAQHYLQLIKLVVAGPEQQVAEIEMTTDAERHEILNIFNDTETRDDGDKTVVELFHAQVARSPQSTAVVFSDSVLTYQELNAKANQVASLLIKRGIKRNNLVGISVRRCPEMIVGILGIIKAGAAYVPIDPEYPVERKRFMIKDAGIVMMVTTLHECFLEGVLGMSYVCLDDIWSGPEPEYLSNPNVSYHVRDLLYVIYTSGSTGTPKGAMVRHRNFHNLLNWFIKHFRLTENDNFLLITSLGFDLTQKNLFAPLITGGTLVISDSQKFDPVKISREVQLYNISNINCTPGMFNSLLNEGENADFEQFCSLRRVFLGGEPINRSTLKAWRDSHHCHAEVTNTYGPTECADICLSHTLDWNNGIEAVPLGKPIYNSQVVILNKLHRLQPIGITGEICITGAGVGAGYLNRQLLTRDKFVRNPFERGGPTLYKTGDLGRWTPNGDIEYLGRMDRQTKIRGRRVELGEVENVLMSFPKIKQCVVVVQKDSLDEEMLCAYFVSRSKVTPEILREFLAKRLPEYMIPSFFLPLERLPLSENGKVDTRVLPLPNQPSRDVSAGHKVPPRNDLDKALIGIWERILGHNDFGIMDDFFQIGGHSLRATQLVGMIGRELNISIELEEVFSKPRIQDLSDQLSLEKRSAFDSIPSAAIKPYYDLSLAQRRLWILSQFEEDSFAYNMPCAFELNGQVDMQLLNDALNYVVSRHESLRTVFIQIDGVPKQRILENFNFGIPIHDLQDVPKDVSKMKVLEMYKEMARTAFELDSGPLFHASVIKLSPERLIFFFNIHHIINDGWSYQIILTEILTAYNDLVQGCVFSLAPVALHYKDYSEWHNQLIQSPSFTALEGYWLKKFHDKPNGIILPFDFNRQAIQTFRGSRIAVTIEREAVLRLRKVCQDTGATLFMGLLALVDLFLHRYTGQRDIIVGAPVAGRNNPDLTTLVGFLVNTLVYRVDVSDQDSFHSLLSKVKEDAMETYKYQEYPFDLLVEKLGLVRDLSQPPLFNVMLAHNNTNLATRESKMRGVGISFYSDVHEVSMSKFDLIFFINEKEGDQLEVVIEYNCDLFKRNTISRLAENFVVVCRRAVESPHARIGQIATLGQIEYDIVTRHFNNFWRDYESVTVQELFEISVAKHPDKIAVVDGDISLTYEELNSRANAIAHHLRLKYGVTRNQCIGISLGRSVNLVAAVLGVIKSGAAYLAIDPNYPQERILHILDDSKTRIILSDRVDNPFLRGYDGTVINIVLDATISQEAKANNPPVVNCPDDIIYIIYTSGSTGTPNGALLTHGILSNLVQWQQHDSGINSSLKCLQFTSINFCVSFQEIMCTLNEGGQVYMIGDFERRDVSYLVDFIATNGIEVLYFPFTFLNLFFAEITAYDKKDLKIKHIVTAGEQLKITSAIRSGLQRYNGLTLHNHYGSSEMHVVSSYSMTSATLDEYSIPPSGRPIANTQIYIIDDYGYPCGIGVWGELYVAGVTEVAGYINNSELTSSKLIRLSTVGGDKRVYKSGDVGRWLEDGNIELSGRKDSQVKIQGFRVEIGEIESKILEVDSVRDCVVLVKTDSHQQKQLVAYVNLDGITTHELKNVLSLALPNYMVPRFIKVDVMPLMPNGKVDRAKLLTYEPDLKVVDVVPPQNLTERDLFTIWSEVLGTVNFGIHDNFFELGGQSLKGAQVVARINRKFGIKLPLRFLFTYPNIEELAEIIKQKSDNNIDTSAELKANSLTNFEDDFRQTG